MRLWAEERKSGSIELLMTQPIELWEAVLGKFLAAWAFTGLALILTFPLWLTVNYLGSPDNGTIFAAYLGSFLMAGGFLAVGSCMSALTSNQVIAFIVTAVICFLFLLAGFPLVLDAFRNWAPQGAVNAIAALSFLSHFDSISKGVIDLRDLLYYAMLIAFFLIATAIALDVRKRSTLGRGLALALGALFIALTVVFGFVLRGWRLDLTQNHLYTTAPGTENIIKSLKEPINLYFFLSETAASQYPAVKTYTVRVREFLDELAQRSKGKIRLTVVDPQPFSEDEDRASELGVRPMPLGQTGTQLYFGLAATNSTNGREAIPFFDPSKEEFLEYDIAKVIYQLGNPKKPVVGWLSALPMAASMDPATGQSREPATIYRQAEELFTLRNLDPQALKIDPDVDVVVIVHPKTLSDAAQYELDQYALRGGRLLVFVDPVAEQDQSGADPQNPMSMLAADKSSHLERLLNAWGVDFDPASVVGDQELALQVGMRQGEAPVRHLGILGLNQSGFNQADVITSGLSMVNIATAGALTPRKDVPVKFEPLLQSSTQAALIPTARFRMLLDPANLIDGFKPTGKRFVIGARISGNIKTAFPSGAPAGAQVPPGQKPLTQSVTPLNLIVIADTDILSDFMWVRTQNFLGQPMTQAFANNGDFAFNAIDNLAGSSDLISVRGRATFSRPFEVVNALRASAETRFRSKEQELETELTATEQKLTSLETARNDQSSVILTPEQERELDRFQGEKLRIRKELRSVRAGLDREIRQLGGTLKFVNIVAAPLMLSLLIALLAAWVRRRHSRGAPA